MPAVTKTTTKRKKDTKKYIGRKFEAIHRSRELAVQFLYSLDVCPEQNFDESLELFMNLDDITKDDTPEVKDRCRKLSLDVWTRKNEIDGVLLRFVTGWRPERMVSVDRAILRLMVLEAFIMKTIPVHSAISEAANLARDYGTKDSSRFVNGVMHRIAEHFTEEKEEKETEEIKSPS